MQARIVEHVQAQLSPGQNIPCEDIATVVAHVVAYLDDHAEHQRWVDEVKPTDESSRDEAHT